MCYSYFGKIKVGGVVNQLIKKSGLSISIACAGSISSCQLCENQLINNAKKNFVENDSDQNLFCVFISYLVGSTATWPNDFGLAVQ